MKRIIYAVCLWLALSSSAYGKDVSLNFKDVDIRSFVEFMAGVSGKTYVLDKRVQGRITILSPTPMPEDQAEELFLSVLEMHGFAAVDSGTGVVKIIPRAESKSKALPLRLAGSGLLDDKMVTQVLPLQYADAQQLVALIRPLIATTGHLVAYPRGNLLLLSDSASNIHRIEALLRLLDRQDAVGVQLFPLKHASADKLATTIMALYASAPGQPGGAVKALSHQPGNILIVVAAPQTIHEIEGVIARLDVTPETDQGRLQVRYLKHANAEAVAKVISTLVSGQTAATPGQAKKLFTSDVKVVPDPATNAILMTADPSDMRAVNTIIDRLDVRRRQVLIEALIIEVSADLSQQLGIEWQASAIPNSKRFTPIGGTSFSNQAGVNAQTVATNPLAASGGGLVIGAVKGLVTLNGTTFLNLAALARALETQGDTNVLSTPNLLTMDNEEAEIIVGQNLPFITGQSSSTGVANPQPFQTIERQDVGLTLRVTPQISEGNTIRLQLYQEVSSVQASGPSGPITNKRSIKTVVLADDGHLIVLGGLMRDDSLSSVQRVPCLGSLPLLGEAFQFTEDQHRKTNLMVFLKPTIIRSSDQIGEITDRKYFDIKSLYERPTKGGTIFLPRPDRKLPAALKPKAVEQHTPKP